MKKFLISCVLLVARIHAEDFSFFPTEYEEVVDACRNETGYTDEVYAEELDNYFSENRGLRKFNYCFLEKTGFVTRDGKLNIDDALANLTPSLFKDLVEKCNSPEKFYPFSIFSTCFHSGVSTYLRLSVLQFVVQVINENFIQIVEDCRIETGYTDEVIAAEEKSDLNKDAGLKKFNNCFLETTGFGADEKFDIDNALAEMPQSNVTELIELCESLITKKIFPNSAPFLSACLHLGVSVYVRATNDTIKLLPETDHVTQIVDVCRMETGFTDEVLHKEKESNFTEEEGLRKFNNCFLEKTGFITSDGKLNIDAALAKLPPSFAKPIIEHCQANIILKYMADSVHDFSTCYLRGVQSRISLERALELSEPFSQSIQLVIPGTSFAGNVFILN